MSKAFVIVAATMLPTLVAAQPLQGLYISGNVGPNFTNSMRSSDKTVAIDTDTGPVGLAALGWRFGNGLRAEIEGSYRSNGVSDFSTRRVNGELVGLNDVRGTLGTSAVMTNLLYDLPVGPRWPVKPYVGAGAGYGWLGLGGVQGEENLIVHLPQNNTFTGPGTASFGAGGAFAYQAIVGVSLPVRQIHGLELTAEYRFFGTGRAGVPLTRVASGGITINGSVPSFATRNGFVAQDSSLLVGARYKFGR